MKPKRIIRIRHGENTTNFKYIEEPRIREQEWGHLRQKEESKKVERFDDSQIQIVAK